MPIRQLTILLIGTLFLFLTTACSANSEAFVVPLKDISAVETEEMTVFEEDQEPFKLAIASILSIRQTHRMYYKFVNYLEEELGRPVEIVQKHTYSEIKSAFREGKIDAGIVCAYLAVIGNDAGIFKSIAMPIRNGEQVFTSYTIVKKDSDFESLADLEGHSFAFSDPLSYSGFLATNYEIAKAGYTKKEFFSNTYFTYSHDNTIFAVANGLVDGGATHSDIYHQLEREDNPFIDKIKIIEVGPYVGNSPFVVSPNLDEQLEKKIVDVISSMHLNERGQKALRRLNFDYFIEPNQQLYEPIHEMLVELGEF
jgi:phosphonate transport system substrate-binding protein